MAFHPFRAFQKHQKAWLAGVTIMAMATFVLCGLGGGDFAGWLLTLVGGKGRAPEVVKLYGKKLDTQDVVQLRQQRLMANQFMETAASVAGGNINAELQRSLDRFGEFKPDVEAIQKELAQSFFGLNQTTRFR